VSPGSPPVLAECSGLAFPERTAEAVAIEHVTLVPMDANRLGLEEMTWRALREVFGEVIVTP
jgi:hypothetical protein